MRKAETLERWRALPAGQNPLRHMRAIPYKATGSSYGACGVRIDGNPAFVDAVLSCLKDLLEGEGVETRLELSRQKVDGRGLNKQFHKKDPDAEVCYIRLHERGQEAQMMEAFCAGARERQQRRGVPQEDHAARRQAVLAELDAAEVAEVAEVPDPEKVFDVVKVFGAKLTPDDVVNRTELPVNRVNAALMLLEMKGQVKRYPGNYYAAAV